jgi:hypothetical protein
MIHFFFPPSLSLCLYTVHGKSVWRSGYEALLCTTSLHRVPNPWRSPRLSGWIDPRRLPGGSDDRPSVLAYRLHYGIELQRPERPAAAGEPRAREKRASEALTRQPRVATCSVETRAVMKPLPVSPAEEKLQTLACTTAAAATVLGAPVPGAALVFDRRPPLITSSTTSAGRFSRSTIRRLVCSTQLRRDRTLGRPHRGEQFESRPHASVRS